MSSHRERKQPRAHSDDHENVKTVLEQISFEEVSPRSVEQSYHSQHNKDQTKSSSMASNSKEDYEWQLLIVRKAVSNPHLAEQGASAGILNNDQLKSSKSDPNQRDETGFDQPNWTQQKKPVVKRNKHKRVRSNEKAPIPPMLTESSKKWNSSAQLPRDSQPETIESSDSSEEVLDNVTIIKVRRTQSSGVLAVTHRRHQSAPRQIGLTKYRRLTDPGCDVHTEEDEHVTDARTGQGLDDGVNLSDPISLAAQPRLIRVTNKAKRKNRHATQQVQKRKSRDADDDKSSSGSHYNSSDSDHERTLFELDESAGTGGSGGKSEVSHATLYSKHIEPILRHTQQLMSTLHLDDDDQDEIEITKFTVQHSAEHEHTAHTALNDEERCPAPDPIAMLCGDMLSNPDSPISPSTSDDEYEDLDRAPTVNMSRAPPRASKSNLLLTRSRPKLSSEPSQSSLTVNTNTNSDSSVAPGTRPQLRVNLASIHEHREASVSQGNFFLHTDRRTFATGTSAMRQMYKTSRSLPKFHVKPVEPEHVMNVPQPVPVSVPVSGVPVSSQTQPLTTPEQSPRIKFTMSTPYLSSTQRMGPTASEQSVVPHVHSSLTTHHSLASLTNNAVIPSPRRSAFQVPARLSTPRASLTDVHSHTSTGPSVPVNSSIIINMPLNSTNTNNANS